MTDQLRSATWLDRLGLYLGRLKRVRIDGSSMSPMLKDGEMVLYAPRGRIAVGDIVIAPHPYKQSVKLIKRVTAIDPGGNVTLLGDNPPESTDSRTLGTVPMDTTLGVVICRL